MSRNLTSRLGLLLAAGSLAVSACLSTDDGLAAQEQAPPPPTQPVASERAADLQHAAPSTTTSTSSPPPAPVPAPAPTTTTTTPRGRLVIHGTGDVNLDPDYIPRFRSAGYESAWTGLGGLFLGDDLTIVNLECAASPLGAALPKAFTFRCDTAALPIMRDFGVEVANLANNHSGDFGKEALIDSRAQLEAAGIAPVGVGSNRREAEQPALFDINGWKIAVLGFGGVVPSPSWLAADDRPGMADGDDTDVMVAAVRAADEVADLVFVTVHWGFELETVPRPDDIARAHAMIDAGADAIFGHHAHRLNPLGWYRQRPIFWGLGNFVWPNFSVAGSTTAVAEVVIEPDGRFGACLLPAFIEAPGHPVLNDPYQGPCGRSNPTDAE